MLKTDTAADVTKKFVIKILDDELRVWKLGTTQRSIGLLLDKKMQKQMYENVIFFYVHIINVFLQSLHGRQYTGGILHKFSVDYNNVSRNYKTKLQT